MAEWLLDENETVYDMQLELMYNGNESWKEGVKGLLGCKQDPLWDDSGAIAVEHNDLAQRIFRAYSYKCMRDGEKQVHNIWADNQRLSQAMVSVVNVLILTCSGSMVPNRCCDTLNASMHRTVGAHFMLAYGLPLYNKGACQRQWSHEGVTSTECLHVVQSLRTAMLYEGVGQSGIEVVDRVAANVLNKCANTHN
ncbi:hypothetical protein K493DRAFT_336230 [Basidiobolus meristosporus CBS 931.73]|uniref:Uncharacterized protein n=1 Tax=Basidiobolus meristosporus CBS 931.73 TaxID=1314790 RepID=A0A1Y1YK67_9FUNG|nr:hypothetical protein K493DRAFT_336230 [Basidiobolus meristosporus CBS 931.73]|eukprot:ORX98233.1 hypothetical protein K493DRAFT_336230 [Basidiobolus meristosporus CBS 931.73]